MADIKNAKYLVVGGVKYDLGWSKNDFTDGLLSKLNGIAEGAQVNVIEKIRLNGTELSVTSKLADLGSLQVKLTAGAGLSLDESGNISVSYDHSLTKVVTVLPSAPANGDENKIHILSNSGSTDAANVYTEYLYINSAWEKIGEFKADVDLSNYVTKETGKGLSTNDYTTADKDKLAGLSNYTHPSYTQRASGMYKITVDATGHVSAAEAAPEATQSASGLMSSGDKTKLDGVSTEANKVTFTYDESTETITATVA